MDRSLIDAPSVDKPGMHAEFSVVGDGENLNFLQPRRRPNFDEVADAGAQESTGDGRKPTDLALFEIGLVDADDPDGEFSTLRCRVGDGGAEEDLVAAALLRWVNHFGGFQALAQEANAPVDLAQAPLAIDVVAVLRAVAIARRPGDNLDDLRTFDAAELLEFLIQTPESCRRHIIRRARR